MHNFITLLHTLQLAAILSLDGQTRLFFSVAPSLTTKPSDQTLTENQEANLRCAAIGNPSPKIAWTKNGAFLTEGELLSFEANRHHSGKYWCSADNGLGVAVNASADLNVQCEFSKFRMKCKALGCKFVHSCTVKKNC